MTFVDLVAGDGVFLDANTFVYHFAPDPAFQAPCADLLQRIANQDLVGYTSTAILSETAHRLMMIEARARLGWSQERSSSDSSRILRSSKASAATELLWRMYFFDPKFKSWQSRPR